ncbi:MAG: NADH-quinone oxidoreductase subunit L [Gammaproteobacteria bacterium]|nr:NADH-quinone oxidoreductase subunit L [Gammaproteobacteria bacterium]
MGTLLLLYTQNNSKRLSIFISNSSILISFFVSIYLLFLYFSCNYLPVSQDVLVFADTKLYSLSFGLYIDSLSLVMSTVVTSVSFLVHYYSISYMKDESSFNRFFIYTNFFTFSMLLIVLSNNFFQLFIGWELVGLSSYLLIGFWTSKESAIKANYKAFLVNRVGDIGLLLGLCLVFVTYGTTNYTEVFNLKDTINNSELDIFGTSFNLLSSICLLLFVGAMAKSAQVPLHFWLPDSMEGPTPISALIHAATMVTAGIYMVARLSPLYVLAEDVSIFILYVGSVTAFFLGLVSLVQNDIKRIIAYSTISQLGYMTAALGASLYSLAIFHLITHAFFKALLFLCAGSIIIKCHHEQDIRKIGGLRKFMPITYLAFLYASLSLIGFPLTSGFYSKEVIIDAIGYYNHTIPYTMLLAGIFITTLYTSKIFFKVFFGECTLHDRNEKENDKEMLVPLFILTAPSVFLGLFIFDSLLSGTLFGASLMSNTVVLDFYNNYVINSLYFFLHSFMTINFFILLIALIFSYYYYYKKSFNISIPNILSTILKNEYGFNNLSTKFIPKFQNLLTKYLWKNIDILTIDNGIINNTSLMFDKISNTVRKFQTGYIYHYSLTIISALILALLIIRIRY